MRRNGFGGAGIRYRLYRDHLEITSVLEGTPAEETDLAPGDHVVAIDGTVVDGLSRRQVHDLLRGPVDSAMHLAVKRAGTERTVTLRRGLVSAPTAFISDEGGIPLLKVTRFSQQTVALSRRLIEENLAERSYNFV